MNCPRTRSIGFPVLLLLSLASCNIDIDTLLPVASMKVNNNGCVAPCAIEASNESERFDTFSWSYNEQTKTDATVTFDLTTTARFPLTLTASSETSETSTTKNIYATFADPAMTTELPIGSDGTLTLPALASKKERYAQRVDFPIATELTTNTRIKFTLSDDDKFADFGGRSDSLSIAGLYIGGGEEADGANRWSNADSLGGYWCGLFRNSSGDLLATLRSTTDLVSLALEDVAEIDFTVEYTDQGLLRMIVSHNGTDSNISLPIDERLLGQSDVSIRAEAEDDFAVRELFFSWLDHSGKKGEIKMTQITVEHQ